MDYPLQYPVNIQTKQFNHSQSYPMAEMTEDTNRESVENIRSVRDNSSQGLKAGQKV